jgi:general secretion pathway protein G
MQKRKHTRISARGVTLVEVLIVVAIMAMVATAVAVAAIKYYEDARRKAAVTNAIALREAVKGYWFTNDTLQCPTVAELISQGSLDEVSSRTDPWGTPWRIECNGVSAVVSSNGSDRQPGTEDDIRVPPKTS